MDRRARAAEAFVGLGIAADSTVLFFPTSQGWGRVWVSWDLLKSTSYCEVLRSERSRYNRLKCDRAQLEEMEYPGEREM